MEVVALSRGFYGGASRRAGERFDVADGAKAAWYTPADSAAAKAKPKAEKVRAQPDTLAKMGRETAHAPTDSLA